MSRPSCVCVSASFNGPGIVACSQHNGCDSVHYAFVVGCTSERIRGCECVCVNDSVNHLFSPQRIFGEDCFGAGKSLDGKVRDYSQVDVAARDLLDHRRDCFDHRVDCVCAHCVPTVNEQLHDHHLTEEGVNYPDLEISCASSQRDQNRVLSVCVL